jgi:GT2 family glycosyltransferase
VKGPASVVVACYNQGRSLPQVLAGFARQSEPGFELILADDGSSEDYEELLRSWAPRFAHGIQRVSHEDLGFRKTRILNRAVHVSRFEALVFTDADCVPHPDFLRNHLRRVDRGCAATGRRVHVDAAALPPASHILASGVGLGPGRLFALWLAGRARVIEHGLSLPLGLEAAGAGILGSNFSVHREDLRTVNGFNEEYRDWGTGEDSDLDLRLRLAGVKVRAFRSGLVQYHIDHDGKRDDSPRNQELLARTRARGLARASVGLAEIRHGDFTHAVLG